MGTWGWYCFSDLYLTLEEQRSRRTWIHRGATRVSILVHPAHMSRSQCLLLRRHVKKRDTGTRRVSSHVGPGLHTARARACTSSNAARERSRVRTLRSAFLKLQLSLPSVPPDTKLSKLDVLLLATDYIQHLTRRLQPTDYIQHLTRRLQPTAQTSSDSADRNTTATSGRRSGRSAEQTSTCQLPQEEMTPVQSLETGRVHRSDSRTLGRLHDETQEDEGCRQVGDSMRRQDRHPVKKWPMRSRLYECILLDTPPSRAGSNDNDQMTNSSRKDV